MDNSNGLTEAAKIKSGDVLSERDGFLWQVDGVDRIDGKMVNISVSPFFRTITAREPRTFILASKAMVRVTSPREAGF